MMQRLTPAITGSEARRSESILIVGLVRNGAGKIIPDVMRMQAAVRCFARVHWLLVESDSEDNSILELQDLCKRIENFRFISMGSLRGKFPLRTDRIAACRNAYLDEVKSNQAYEHVDFVIAADFDGINTLISEDAIVSCWDRSDWSVCTANQAGPYYDILALRHATWCPIDCIAGYQFLVKYGVKPEKALQAAVHSRMITIPKDSHWIEVDSAFGGVAIYKKSSIINGTYRGLTTDGCEVCEHVQLHAEIRANGGKIFINPRLINASYTEHTVHLKLHRKMIRMFKNLSKLIFRTLVPDKSAAM